ncbi:phage head closure protein [Ascidiaceihabitans sp.]|uniref:phage head closure protein n=1 Tax=Ascidiaceihabitans sp. TaxID=1872644 RepID=UPI003297098E
MSPRLNRRLTLEAPDHLSDGAGGFSQSWTAVGVLWAEVVARTGREATQSGAPLSEVSYKITVRAAPVGHIQRPTSQQRFRDGNRIFRIQAVAETNMGACYLTCFANEEVVS